MKPPMPGSAGGLLSSAAAGVLRLPPFSYAVAALYHAFLSPEGVPHPDFLAPAGEPALTPAGSVSWQIYKNPVTLFMGGIAAVALELSEARVRHGVWTHSDFRRNPVERLRRTGLAAMVTVYGAESVATRMIKGIAARHDRVSGVTETGRAYCANDSALLDWVQLTAAYGFAAAWDRFVRPLRDDEWDAVYREAEPAARLYGATSAPRRKTAAEAYVAGMIPALSPSPVLGEFLSLMRTSPIMPWGTRGIQRLLVKAALTLVPPAAAAAAGIPVRDLSPRERGVVCGLARTADRLPVRGSPQTDACVRMGHSWDRLYRLAGPVRTRLRPE